MKKKLGTKRLTCKMMTLKKAARLNDVEFHPSGYLPRLTLRTTTDYHPHDSHSDSNLTVDLQTIESNLQDVDKNLDTVSQTKVRLSQFFSAGTDLT